MPSRSWQFRIDDILEVINKIERYTVDAVIRNLEIIGEASSHLPAEVQAHYEDVPWNMMKGIRNILAHEYFGIDLGIVWKTVKEDLPVLRKRLL